MLYLSIFINLVLSCQASQAYYKLQREAQSLERRKVYKKAEEAFKTLEKLAMDENNTQWLFKVNSDLSWFYYRQNKNIKQEQHLLLTVKYADIEYQNNNKPYWLYEKARALGYLESNYSRQCKIGFSYKTHKEGISELTKLINHYHTEGIDILSGVFPTKLPRSYVFIVTRALWREAFHLDIQGKTYEAIKTLENAQWKYPKGVTADRMESSYQLKVLSELALRKNLLGYVEEGIKYHQKIIDHPSSRFHKKSVNIAKENTLYFKAKYYGPKDEYIQEAFERYKEACRLSPSGEDQGSKKLLFKLTALIDPEKANTDVLKEIATTLGKQGDKFNQHYAKRDLAVEKLKRGETEGLEKEFLVLLQNCRKKGIKRGEPTIYREYALLLEKLGRFEEAVKIMEQAIVMTKSFNWYLHLPRLLNMQCRFQIALNDFDSAERVWDEIDSLLAKHDDFPPVRLLEIMVFRMEYLLAIGDTVTARIVQYDAIDLIKSSGLNSYQAEFYTKKDWEEKFKKADSTTEIDEKEHPVITDLQPASILTKVIPGEKANARFSIINESYKEVEGTLKIKGVESSIQIIQGQISDYLLITVGARSTDNESSVTLSAGTTLPVIFTSKILLDEDIKHELNIEWHTEGATPKVAYWQFQADADPLETSIVNSNLAWLNPFYSIPLYHTIFNRTKFAELTDLCVESTIPCRVELYNADTSELLAVDNNANGSFFDEGDTLSVDDNQSGLPEVLIDRFVTVLLKVFHLEENETQEEDFILTLKLKVAGEWVSYAQNRIMLPSDER